MRRLINVSDQSVIALVEGVNFIKLSGEGNRILCDEQEARGICYNGRVYNILGAEPLPDVNDTVQIMQVDGGQEIQNANNVNSIVFVTMAEQGNLDDTTISEHSDMFPAWVVGVAYTVGKIVVYSNGILYKCVQAHTSQADWTPDKSANLWTPVADPAEEWPVWSQPVGAHDAYAKGDKVSHNDKHWVSTADNNVWEPGVYGWEESVE